MTAPPATGVPWSRACGRGRWRVATTTRREDAEAGRVACREDESKDTRRVPRRTKGQTTKEGRRKNTEASASLAMPHRSMTLPPRRTPSAAMTHVAPALAMRDASESREKPPKTTVCTAPIRAREHGDGELGDHRHK